MALEPTGTPSRAGIQQAIEDAITKRVQSGSLTSSAISAGTTWADVGTVTFPVAFDVVPKVTVQGTTAHTSADLIGFRPRAVTTTGFTLSARADTAKGAQAVDWIAATPPP